MHGTQVQMTQFALQKLLHTSPFKQVNSQFYSNPVLKEFPGARLLVLNIFADCGPSGGPYTPWTSYIYIFVCFHFPGIIPQLQEIPPWYKTPILVDQGLKHEWHCQRILELSF